MLLPKNVMEAGEIRSASQVSDINHKLEQEMFIGISTKTVIKKYLWRETYHQLKTKTFLCCLKILF